MLIQLTYASQAVRAMSVMDIMTILKSSRRNNAARGISGALCVYKDIFLQQLEGDEADVHALYERIVADGRHRDVRVIDKAPILQRRFSQWSMGLVAESRDNHLLFSKYLPAEPLSPGTLDAAPLRALFADIVNNARWIE